MGQRVGKLEITASPACVGQRAGKLKCIYAFLQSGFKSVSAIINFNISTHTSACVGPLVHVANWMLQVSFSVLV